MNELKVTFLLVIVLLSSINFEGLAQTTYSDESELTIDNLESVLVSIIDNMSESSNSLERNELNSKLIETLYEGMYIEGALSLQLDSLHSISDLKTKKGDFRIFTWELENSNQEIVYYGIVAYLFEKQLYVLKLNDKCSEIENPELKKLNGKKWFGSLYYDLREYSYKKESHIVLLGINRSDLLTKKRIIEVVEIGEKLSFGKEVFNFPGRLGIKRKVYPHSLEAEMSILFDKEEDRIILDHLSPLKPMYEGKFEYYVPDLSFDALNYEKGIWNYESDVDVKMEPDFNDQFQDMELPSQNKVY